MSDTRLRELERRWKETGTVEDEAAYLLERVRVGDLTQERLELAAYCGHEGAGRAVGSVAPPNESNSVFDVIVGLQRWGMPTVGVAMVTLSRLALPVWERVCPEPEERDLARAVVEALERWSAVPTDEHRSLLAAAVRRGQDANWHPSSVVIVTGASAVILEDTDMLLRAASAAIHVTGMSSGDAAKRIRATVASLALLGVMASRGVTEEPGS